jgi:hypothetical protein
MVEKHLVYSARPSVVGVITDNIDAINHADGKRYTSKAKFRAATKAAGCIEIGNEKIPERKPIKLDRYQRREQIRQAIYELRNR